MQDSLTFWPEGSCCLLWGHLVLLKVNAVLWCCFSLAFRQQWLDRHWASRCAGWRLPTLDFYSPWVPPLQTVKLGPICYETGRKICCWSGHFCRRAGRQFFPSQWWTVPLALPWTPLCFYTIQPGLQAPLATDVHCRPLPIFRRPHRYCCWTEWVHNIWGVLHVYFTGEGWHSQQRTSARVGPYRSLRWRLAGCWWCDLPGDACCAGWWLQCQGCSSWSVFPWDPCYYRWDL